MLKAIQANDESANAQRRAKGLAALHTRRWLERPTLHADTNTVSWIIEGGDDQNDRTINAVALKLGRYGFERIVWIARHVAVVGPVLWREHPGRLSTGAFV